MKKQLLITLFFIGSLTSLFSQSVDYNTSGGAVAKGYDVVSYFSHKAVKGSDSYKITHDGVKYKFSSQANLDKFKAHPEKYAPQYGGWCAYAIAKGSKAKINPNTYEIRDGKLYLFYNAGKTNTYELWKEEGPEKLRDQADKEWEKLK